MSYIVRVWDAPTRLFHWALVLCVIGLLVTAKVGGGAMDWHFRFGYGVLTLLLFRLVWGFVGGYWSRFANFLYRPDQIRRYLQGRAEATQSVGHNPLGALSVFAMLGFLALQVGTGLFSDDEIAATGPLSRYVSGTIVGNATFYHKAVGKYILLMLVALHLAAIAFYFYKKHANLVAAMLSGDKLLDDPARSAHDRPADRIRALLILLVCGVAVYSLLMWVS